MDHVLELAAGLLDAGFAPSSYTFAEDPNKFLLAVRSTPRKQAWACVGSTHVCMHDMSICLLDSVHGVLRMRKVLAVLS